MERNELVVTDLRARSILIAVEGIDGAGKTTQVELLREALDRIGETPIVSKEPTNGQWGRIIKESASTGRLAPEAELEAFLNDRAEHVTTLVNPSLDQGRIVILDRYFYSSIAYQGSRGVDPNEVQSIMEARFPIPDAVFLLDIDPILGVHRIAHSRGETPNHFEDRKNLAKAREVFNAIKSSIIHKIDASMSREAVYEQILTVLIDGALKQKRCAKAYGCDDPYNCTFRITGSCEWVRLARALRSTAPVTA